MQHGNDGGEIALCTSSDSVHERRHLRGWPTWEEIQQRRYSENTEIHQILNSLGYNFKWVLWRIPVSKELPAVLFSWHHREKLTENYTIKPSNILVSCNKSSCFISVLPINLLIGQHPVMKKKNNPSWVSQTFQLVSKPTQARWSVLYHMIPSSWIQ